MWHQILYTDLATHPLQSPAAECMLDGAYSLFTCSTSLQCSPILARVQKLYLYPASSVLALVPAHEKGYVFDCL